MIRKPFRTTRGKAATGHGSCPRRCGLLNPRAGFPQTETPAEHLCSPFSSWTVRNEKRVKQDPEQFHSGTQQLRAEPRWQHRKSGCRRLRLASVASNADGVAKTRFQSSELPESTVVRFKDSSLRSGLSHTISNHDIRSRVIEMGIVHPVTVSRS